MPSQSPPLSFAGHESFPLRFGWLKKGYRAIASDAGFFQRPDAMVDLGVGKNMVRAIRHWGLACGVWAELEGQRGRLVEATPLGRALLADEGWDPFLEDPASVWWLHWTLTRSPDRATAWAYVFGQRSAATALSRDLLAAELDDLQRDVETRRTPISSLRRDAEVLIRSYAGSSRRSADEDSVDSLFTQLGLIRPTAERGHYEVVVGDPPSLTAAVVAAAIEAYAASRPDRRHLPLHELLYAPMSPGRVFRLTERAMVRRLQALRESGWVYDETAGLREVIRPDREPDPLAALAQQYQARADEAAA